MVEKLFVYGTLGLGRPNEHILSNIGGAWEAATVTGILREEGWGAEMGYPGIVIDEQGKEVKGFLFTSENLPQHWASLDKFEGEAYSRVQTKVKLENGTNDKSLYLYVKITPIIKANKPRIFRLKVKFKLHRIKTCNDLNNRSNNYSATPHPAGQQSCCFTMFN